MQFNNKQEIFEYVAKHLFTQGIRSYGSIGDGKAAYNNCLYRGPDGISCAAGCVIPDQDYDKDMEGHDIFQLHGRFSLPSYIENNINLLSSLQATHDEIVNWNSTFDMRKGLLLVAKQHGLNAAFLDNLSFKDR